MIKRLIDRLLKWYLNPEFYPDIAGDLEELYQRNAEEYSTTRANILYLNQVIVMFRPSLIKPLFKNSIINTGMFTNYLKISFRSMLKHKVYASINIVGLAIGLAAFLLIDQYVAFEKSYDRFFNESDLLHRLSTDQVVDGVLGVRDAMSYNPSGKALMEELPEVLGYTCTYKFDGMNIRFEDQVLHETGVIASDEHFLDLFTYDIIQKEDDVILDEPNTVVLTEKIALKYFGTTDVIGKKLHFHSEFDKSFKIVGVIQDVPKNTHYQFNMIISLITIEEKMKGHGWDAYNYYTYLKLKPGTDLEELNQKLIPLSRKYIGEGSNLDFTVHPVSSIYLHSDFTYEPDQYGSAKAVGFLTVISIFILVIAWVNYINLSTARAVDRAKEVGLRKVVGAYKRQLIGQFLTEALLVNFLGAFLAIVLSEIALPSFNHLVGKPVLLHTWESQTFLVKLILFFLGGSLVSGFYPAFVLSGFKPVEVLKGKFRNSGKGIMLRKGLVVVQFSASMMLLGATYVVYEQVQHMREKDLGMDIEKVIGVPFGGDGEWTKELQEKRDNFLKEVKKHQLVEDAAQMSNLPGGKPDDINSTSNQIKIVGLTSPLEVTTYVQGLDYHALELLKFELIHGRNFDKHIKADSNAVIVNASFIERFGIPVKEDIIGKKLQFGSREDNWFRIIGIVKNANRGSVKHTVEPTSYFNWSAPGIAVIRLKGNDLRASLQHVNTIWADFFPNAPFEYSFIDDRFDRLYEEDMRFGNVFATFAVFAIIVAALGLFGLASFLAIQRSKEIGVRKVLGASVSQIISIFMKDFIILMVVAIFIGGPAIYFGMDWWLNNYAYRIDFPWVTILISAIVLAAVCFATIGYQTFRVARLNPAVTLKDE